MTRLSDRPRAVAAVLLAVALLLAPIRIVLEARAELAAAEAATLAGDPTRAIDHFRRTLRWSLPLFNRNDEAVAGLERIARDLEAAGDRDGALLAWRSIVGGLASARSLYAPTNPAVRRAKNEITRLAVGPDEAGRYRQRLDGEISPSPVGATLLLLGFFTWIASLLLLAGKGFDERGRPRLDSARGAFFGAVAGFASFIIGLLSA